MNQDEELQLPSLGLQAGAELREFIDMLHANSLEGVVELPMIAVFGDTSSGKSSLLSQISGFEFPSHSGICTRCPTRLHLECHRERSYRVEVEWKPGTAGTPFSKPCDSVESLHQAMLEAQQMVKQHSQSAISSNVVHVKLCSPDVVDLTIVDLPGLVSTTGRDEDPQMIQQIRDLVNEYLANKRCVILAIHPGTVDFHNSQVISDARAHDPTTRRTFPVVTKADLVQPGEEQSVIDLLRQQKTHRFELGFHLVKCRSQKEVNDKVSIAACLAAESTYFSRHEAWRTLDPTSVGVVQLQRKLSAKYMAMVSEYAPAIKKELASRLAEYEEKARVLYVPHGSLECDQKFREATDKIHHYLSLFESFEGLDQLPFREQIANRKKKKMKGNKEAAEQDSNDVEDSKEMMTTYRAKLEALKGSFYDTIVELSNEQKIVGVEEIMERICATKRCVPRVFVDQQLFTSLIEMELKEKWEPVFHKYVDETMKVLRMFLDEVERKIRVDCKLFPKLASKLRLLLSQHVEKTFTRGVAEARRHWAELCQPHPMNNHYQSENVQKKRMREVLDAIEAVATPIFFDSPREGEGEKYVPLSSVQKILNETGAKGIDEYLAEEARYALSGYLRTLSKLVGDGIPIAVEQHIISKTLTINFMDAVPPSEREAAFAVPFGAREAYQHAMLTKEALSKAMQQSLKF